VLSAFPETQLILSTPYGEGIDPSTGREIGTMDVWGTRSALRWRVLALYNEETRTLARNRGLPLIDLARTLPKDSRFYFDFIHYSIEGAGEVARQVSDRLTVIGGLQTSSVP
jgi:hypothetical protein